MFFAMDPHLCNAFSLHMHDVPFANFPTKCGVNLSWPGALLCEGINNRRLHSELRAPAKARHFATAYIYVKAVEWFIARHTLCSLR